MVHTNCQAVARSCVRRVDNGRVEIPIPLCIQLYNRFMGGVDLADQRRSYYEVLQKTVKYWKYIMWGVVEFALSNAWVLYSKVKIHFNSKISIKIVEKQVEEFHASDLKLLNLRNIYVIDFQSDFPDKVSSYKLFRLRIVKQLIDGFSSRERRGRPWPAAFELNNRDGTELLRGHKMKKGTDRISCQHCINTGRKQPKGGYYRTLWTCVACQVPLCLSCNPKWHVSYLLIPKLQIYSYGFIWSYLSAFINDHNFFYHLQKFEATAEATNAREQDLLNQLNRERADKEQLQEQLDQKQRELDEAREEILRLSAAQPAMLPQT